MSVDGFDVDAALNVQTDNFQRLKRGLENFKKDNATRKSQRIYYQTKFKIIETMVAAFEDQHRIIVENIPSGQTKKLGHFTDDLPMQFENAQVEFICALQAAYEANFPDENVPPRTEAPHNGTYLQSQLTLPAVSIPSFSGAFSEWKTFHDLFKSIVHKNENLPASHKFQYLCGVLSGNAHDLVAGFDVCDEDYPKAWKLLCDTYNDKPSMFVHIMNNFASLESVNGENPEQLRQIVKATSVCFKSLESVGVAKEAVDPVITFYLMQKLPVETMAFWEQVRDRKKMPLFDELKACTETRIRISCTVASIKVAGSQHETRSETSQRHQSGGKGQPPARKKTVKAHHASKTSAPAITAKVFKCPACNEEKENHPIRNCEKFLALSCADRKAFIVRIGYCTNCLAYNHDDVNTKCKSYRNCSVCGERHHSLLHVPKSATEATRISAHAAMTTTNFNSYVTQQPMTTKVLLATAVVKAREWRAARITRAHRSRFGGKFYYRISSKNATSPKGVGASDHKWYWNGEQPIEPHHVGGDTIAV